MDIELNKFKALSDDQVVELVTGVVDWNKSIQMWAPWNGWIFPSSTHNVGRILNVTYLNELIICNSSLSLKEVAQVAANRITKVTDNSEGPVRSRPPALTWMLIREIGWTTLDVDALAPSPADMAGALVTLSLDIQTPTMLHPMHYPLIYSAADNNCVFAELAALPPWVSPSLIRPRHIRLYLIARSLITTLYPLAGSFLLAPTSTFEATLSYTRICRQPRTVYPLTTGIMISHQCIHLRSYNRRSQNGQRH